MKQKTIPVIHADLVTNILVFGIASFIGSLFAVAIINFILEVSADYNELLITKPLGIIIVIVITTIGLFIGYFQSIVEVKSK